MRFKKSTISVAIGFVLTLLMSLTPTKAQVIQLSPEGVARKAAHTFLFGEYSKEKSLKFIGQKPSRILDEIVISNETRQVSGNIEIRLPVGSARVASLFRYIVLKGENVDELGPITMLPYASQSHLAVSTQQKGIYRVKVPSMPIPAEKMAAIVLKMECRPGTSATINEVTFNSQGKLSENFDDIPYRNLGAEFPREKVKIQINTGRELSLEGHIDLERDKFCRYYAAPGHVHPSFEKWAAERNFLPGRQILKFQPALVKGYSPNQPKLKEDNNRKGAADLTFFERYEDTSSTIDEFRNIKYAMCFNDYPEFMSIPKVGRGTPLVEHFDDAAQLAAAFIANQIQDRGRSANYWEVKNESTIKAEWDYHWNQNFDSWALMADLHNKVADEVHKTSPDIMVGGPSSAWMQVQVKDFSLYQNQVKFMDLTKGHVDFYSHHFYEDFGTLGAWERRQGKYTNYLLGRMESILDMFRAHMKQTNNLRPILITECGSLQPGRGPSDYWLRLRSYSAYMHKLMKRPEQIELAVPFVFLSIPWNPNSGNAAFIPREGESNYAPRTQCDPTPITHFFELWRDFDGRRLPTVFDRKFLDVTAVHQNDRIQLAITNMGGRRVLLNIEDLTGPIPVKAISQKRMYYRDGEVVYEELTHESGDAIPVDVEETTIVSLNLKSEIQPAPLPLIRENWFAAGTAIKSNPGSGNEFLISVNHSSKERSSKIESATLHIGVQREGGLGGPISGSINGSTFQSKSEWADQMNHLFGTIQVPLDTNTIRPDNKIFISGREGLTITSVHLETESIR